MNGRRRRWLHGFAPLKFSTKISSLLRILNGLHPTEDKASTETWRKINPSRSSIKKWVQPKRRKIEDDRTSQHIDQFLQELKRIKTTVASAWMLTMPIKVIIRQKVVPQ
jgi:hypothetical protein